MPDIEAYSSIWGPFIFLWLIMTSSPSLLSFFLSHSLPFLGEALNESLSPLNPTCLFSFLLSNVHFMVTTGLLSTFFLLFTIFLSLSVPSLSGVDEPLDERAARPLHLLPEPLDLRLQPLILVGKLLHLPLVLLLPLLPALLPRGRRGQGTSPLPLAQALGGGGGGRCRWRECWRGGGG